MSSERPISRLRSPNGDRGAPFETRREPSVTYRESENRCRFDEQSVAVFPLNPGVTLAGSTKKEPLSVAALQN